MRRPVARQPSSGARNHGAGAEQAELIRAALVARRYFLDGQSKVDIADQLGISRFLVARLIDLARHEHIVRIEIVAPLNVRTDLGLQLADTYELEEAWVLDPGPATGDDLRRELGRLGAVMLADLIKPGDVVGVSWGRTMLAMADALPELPTCTIVQLAGGLPNDTTHGASELVRRFAERATGDVHQLHAPLFVSDPRTAARLRSEPQISRTMSMYDKLTKVIVGLGPPARTSPVASALSPEEFAVIERAAPTAEMCGMWISPHGEVLSTPLTRRTMAISEEQLRAVPQVVAVAGGPDKVAALHAALTSGICSRLVTDSITAEKLLGSEHVASSAR